MPEGASRSDDDAGGRFFEVPLVATILIQSGCSRKASTVQTNAPLPFFGALTVDSDSMRLSTAYASMGVVARVVDVSQKSASPYTVKRFVLRLERAGVTYFVDTAHQAALNSVMVDTLRSTALPGDRLVISNIRAGTLGGEQQQLDSLSFTLFKEEGLKLQVASADC